VNDEDRQLFHRGSIGSTVGESSHRGKSRSRNSQSWLSTIRWATHCTSTSTRWAVSGRGSPSTVSLSYHWSTTHCGPSIAVAISVIRILCRLIISVRCANLLLFSAYIRGGA